MRLRAEVPLVSHREERARNLCLAGYRGACLHEMCKTFRGRLLKTVADNLFKIRSSLWLNDGQSFNVLKSLNDRQTDIFI